MSDSPSDPSLDSPAPQFNQVVADQAPGEQPMAEEPTTTAKRRGLAPGCLLLIFSGLMLLVFTVVLLWNGNAQLREIRKFTTEEAAWTEVAPVSDKEETALRTRLNAFSDKLENAEECAILLTPEDMAHAIAFLDPLEALRGTYTPTAIVTNKQGQRVLQADICFELNAMLPWQATPYLVGTMEIAPEATRKGPWLKIVALESTHGPVPEEIRHAMDQQDPLIGGLRDSSRNPRGSAALDLIRYVELTDTGLLLATSESAASSINSTPSSS